MLIDFHGWEMPVRYTSIPQEHQQVRESAGLFDLCHMGRLAISGPQAEEWLQALITNDTAAIETGNARYTLFCQEDGTILVNRRHAKALCGQRWGGHSQRVDSALFDFDQVAKI